MSLPLSVVLVGTLVVSEPAPAPAPAPADAAPASEPAEATGPGVTPPAKPWVNHARLRRVFFDATIDAGGGGLWGSRGNGRYGFGRAGFGVLALVHKWWFQVNAFYDASGIDWVAFGLGARAWYPRFLLHGNAGALATPDGRFGVIAGIGATLLGFEYQFRDTLQYGLTNTFVFKVVLPLTMLGRMMLRDRF